MNSKVKLVTTLKATPRADGLWPMECLRIGHWDYAGIPGGLAVDQALLKDLKSNFDAGAKGFEVLLNREHDDDRPAGWVKGLELAADGNSLIALVDITDEESKGDVEDEKVKYCSSELDLAWLDPEDKSEKRVFEGLALTNRPYIKRLKPIGVVLSERSANLRLDEDAEEPEDEKPKVAASEDEPVSGPPEKEDTTVDPKDKKTEEPTGGGAVALSELKATLAEETAARKRLEAQLAESDKQSHDLSARIRLNDATARINKAYKKGKVTPAFAKTVLAFAEAVIQHGDTTKIKLSAKVKIKLADGEEKETDELDIVDGILDMIDTLPDDLVVDGEKEKADLSDEEKEPKDDEDDLDKAAKAEMKENKDLTYEAAVHLAERKRKEKKRS